MTARTLLGGACLVALGCSLDDIDLGAKTVCPCAPEYECVQGVCRRLTQADDVLAPNGPPANRSDVDATLDAPLDASGDAVSMRDAGDGAVSMRDAAPPDVTVSVYRKKITIDGADANGVVGAQTAFPVLVRITDADLENNADASGRDIYFTDDLGNLLTFERESYDSTNGALVAWVKMNLTGADQDFYIHYGNGDRTEKSSSMTWSSGFSAVYHMDYGGGAGTEPDSTSNANDAVPDTYTGGGCSAAAMAPANQAAGIIGKALTFGGNTCNRLMANDTNSLDLTNELTGSAWVKPAAATGPANGESIVAKRIRVTEEMNYQLSLSSAHNVTFTWGWGTGNYPSIASSPAATPAAFAWSYVVWTVQGSPKGLRTYLDGARINSSDQTTSNGGVPASQALTLTANTQPLFIGGNDQETDEVFFGDLDEVRIASVARSAAWITTEYNNQKPSSTFFKSIDAPE